MGASATDATCYDYKTLYKEAGCCGADGAQVDPSVSTVIVKKGAPVRTHAWKMALELQTHANMIHIPPALAALVDGKTFRNTFWTQPAVASVGWGKSETTFYMKDDKQAAYMCDFHSNDTIKECVMAAAMKYIKETPDYHVVRFGAPFSTYKQADEGFKYGLKYFDLYMNKNGGSYYYKEKVYLDMEPPEYDFTTAGAQKMQLVAAISQPGGLCPDVIPSMWEAVSTGGTKTPLYKNLPQLAEVGVALPAILGQCIGMSTFTVVAR